MRMLGRLIAAGLLALVLLAPVARGQDELLNEAGPFGVPVGWRVVNTGCKRLGFDADQMDSAKSLYQGYRASIKDVSSKATTASQELRKSIEGGNPDWQEYSRKHSALIRKYVDDLEALETGLMSDLKALCTAKQEAEFVCMERVRRRDKGRTFTLAPGEAIDLFALLAQFKIDHATGPVHDAVAVWEENLDRLLVSREKILRNAMTLMGAGGEQPKPEEVKKFFGELTAVATRIGDLNRKTVNEVIELIPEEKRDALRQELKVRTFPRIYGESSFDRAVRSAKADAHLSADQMRAVDELAAKYAVDSAPVNVRWAAAAEDKFRNMGDDPMTALGMGREPDEKEPFYAIRKERKALDERYRGKLLDLLNEGQRAEVSKADGEGGREAPEYLPEIEKEVEGRMKEWKDEEGG